MTSFGTSTDRTTSASLPSRPRSAISSTTMTSPRRKRNISGHGVGFTMATVIPRCASMRARAVSEPQPSPSELIWVDNTIERPARSSRARRSIAVRRPAGTTSRSRTSFFCATKFRVALSVREVDHQSDHEPHDEPVPGFPRQTSHDVTADQDAQNRHERHERRAERPLDIRVHVPEYYYASANDHERKQRTDVHKLSQSAHVEQTRNDRGDAACENRGDVRSLKFWMDLPEHSRKQPIARHREKDSRLAHQHD